MSATEKSWEWKVEDSFNPRYDAWVTAEGLSYACEIQGPFCGYDSEGKQIVCVDLANGRHVGTVGIGFIPDAGLVCGTDLVLADGTTAGAEEPRVVCVSSEGAIRWRATTATETAGPAGNVPGGRGAEAVLRSYDATNTKRSEIRYARSGYRAGILYANVVAQPDRS